MTCFVHSKSKQLACNGMSYNTAAKHTCPTFAAKNEAELGKRPQSVFIVQKGTSVNLH